jgi:hypothetical protein
MEKEHCANCGFPLSEESIRLAIADACLPQAELAFCCPSYHPTADGEGVEGCKGTAKEDKNLTAYWYAV